MTSPIRTILNRKNSKSTYAALSRASREGLPIKRNLQGAFTFLELIFVIAIVALIYTFAAPNLSVFTGAEQSVKLGALAADIRNAYDLSVLSRRPYRMVIDFVSGRYQLQTTEARDFKLGDEKMARDPTFEEEKVRQETFDEEFEAYEEIAGDEVQDIDNDRTIQPVSPVLQAKEKLRPVQWYPVASRQWKNKTIGPYLMVMDMWAEHHAEKQTYEALEEEARGYLYFFPQGYVEKAVIHLALRDGDRIDTSEPPYTLTTNPYLGTADVESGYKEYDVHGDYKNEN